MQKYLNYNPSSFSTSPARATAAPSPRNFTCFITIFTYFKFPLQRLHEIYPLFGTEWSGREAWKPVVKCILSVWGGERGPCHLTTRGGGRGGSCCCGGEEGDGVPSPFVLAGSRFEFGKREGVKVSLHFTFRSTYVREHNTTGKMLVKIQVATSPILLFREKRKGANGKFLEKDIRFFNIFFIFVSLREMTWGRGGNILWRNH